jgi:hypothetical protein
LYGIDHDLCYRDVNESQLDPPEVTLGQRARDRHTPKNSHWRGGNNLVRAPRSTPITELLSDWPHDYRQIVERRIAMIESDPNIASIAQPSTNAAEHRAMGPAATADLTHLAPDRLESAHYWPDPAQTPELTSCTRLAERQRATPTSLQVAVPYRSREDFDVLALVSELVTSEAVPFLPVLRYKPLASPSGQSGAHLGVAAPRGRWRGSRPHPCAPEICYG